jgi:hypothetical protein
MPTLPELLSQLQFVTQEAALLGVFVTASIILISRDWRSLILALLVQYILVGLILSRLVRPDIATLKVMIGAFICPILFLSARQVSVSARPSILSRSIQRNNGLHRPANWKQALFVMASLFIGKDRRRGPASTGLVFKIFTTLVMILVAINLSNSFALPGLSHNVNTAVYWLILAGLATLVLTEDPVKVGHGLFTTIAGFELFYSTVERSLLLTGLWAAANLLIALAVGYLIVVKGTGPEEEL